MRIFSSFLLWLQGNHSPGFFQRRTSLSLPCINRGLRLVSYSFFLAASSNWPVGWVLIFLKGFVFLSGLRVQCHRSQRWQMVFLLVFSLSKRLSVRYLLPNHFSCSLDYYNCENPPNDERFLRIPTCNHGNTFEITIISSVTRQTIDPFIKTPLKTTMTSTTTCYTISRTTEPLNHWKP